MASPYQGALYYPYVHIRDVEWLKRTLLVFPYVARMIPKDVPTADRPEIAKFVETYDKNGPLLRPAALYDASVSQAAERLRCFLADYLNRSRTKSFNRAATAAAKSASGDEYGFQLHPGKAANLVKFLSDKNLAWSPGLRDPWGPAEDYVEVHPRLGAAIMSTLAIACARNEGLAIVTGEAGIHAALTTLDESKVLEAIIQKDDSGDPGTGPNDVVLNFIVYSDCDVTSVNAQSIVALHEEREALQDLRVALSNIATSIPQHVDGREYRDQYVRDAVSAALREWERSRANLGHFRRVFFGTESTKPGEILLGKIAEKAAGETVGGAVIGGLTSGSLIGSVAGCAVGIVLHAVRSVGSMYATQRSSPYRYLTMMERHGVVFHTSSPPIKTIRG